MTKKIRNILFSFFVLMFFGLSIWILILAFGYSFSPYGLRLEKTGMFDIKTEPKKAQINITQFTTNENIDLKNNGNTPAKIQGIQPADYLITLSLNGYHTWQKKLAITGGQTTYLENVIFFKDSLPQLLQATNSSETASSLSLDKSKVLFAGKNWITLIDLKNNNKINNFTGANINENNISWSNNSENVIIGNLLIANNKSQNLAQILGVNNKFSFGLNNNDLIYYNNNEALKSYNLNNKERKNLIKTEAKDKIIDFLVKDNYIYLLVQNNQSYQTAIEIFNNSNEQIGKIDLKNITDYRFVNYTSQWLNLYDAKNKNLYLVDIKYPFAEKYDLKTIANVNSSSWRDNNNLLLNGQNDLRIWQRETNKENTITRLGETINQASWHASDNYLLLSTNNTIYSLELDDRNGRLYLPLAQNMEIDSFYPEADGNFLIIAGKIGKQNGIYKLDLK